MSMKVSPGLFYPSFSYTYIEGLSLKGKFKSSEVKAEENSAYLVNAIKPVSVIHCAHNTSFISLSV